MTKFAFVLLLLASVASAHNNRDPWPPMTTTTTPCEDETTTTTTTLPEPTVCADPCPATIVPTHGVSCHIRKDGSLRCPRRGTAHRILILDTDSRYPNE